METKPMKRVWATAVYHGKPCDTAIPVYLAADVEAVESALRTMTAGRNVLHDNVQELKHALAAKEAELVRYQEAIRQGLWGGTAPDEPHGKEIFVIRREVVKLHAELAHEQDLVNEYDDLLPVSWQTNALLDRHNDVLAYFDQETEDGIKDRLISRINRKAIP